MDRFDRIYDLHKLLSSSRYPVSREKIEEYLECSRATAKRVIESMRLYLDAPIKYDRELNGYFYDREPQDLYELPGLWFNASELYALLSVQQLLESVQPGLFDKQLQPLIKRIDKLLQVQNGSADTLTGRVKILQIANRASAAYFQLIAGATIERKRLQIDYYIRSRDQTESREISPQRLIHYRDNWYLDGWCHKREALRTFAMDAIQKARVLKQQAKSLSDLELDEHFGSAYGIFSGKADKTAVLKFSGKIARWVSLENWHPQQQGKLLDNGEYELRLPYHNPTELIMDILKYGPEVKVLKPADLKQAVIEQLQQSLKHYQ